MKPGGERSLKVGQGSLEKKCPRSNVPILRGVEIVTSSVILIKDVVPVDQSQLQVVVEVVGQRDESCSAW